MFEVRLVPGLLDRYEKHFTTYSTVGWSLGLSAVDPCKSDISHKCRTDLNNEVTELAVDQLEKKGHCLQFHFI